MQNPLIGNTFYSTLESLELSPAGSLRQEFWGLISSGADAMGWGAGVGHQSLTPLEKR